MSTAPESSSSAIEALLNVANECNENDPVCGNTKNCETMSVDVTTVQHTPVCPKKHKLQQWLNKNLRIEMTDGRVLIGVFLCTDRDSNIILGSCSEYLTTPGEDGRILGLVMIPGRHIVSIQIEATSLETT